MMGNNTKQTIPYMKDAHNNKLDHPHEKEPIFRRHLQNIFTDQGPPENTFNQPHVQDTELIMQQQQQRTSTLQ